MKQETSVGAPALFYPIVPDSSWVARLAPLGVKTIQLRVKDSISPCVGPEIKTAIAFGKRFGCQIIVNDFWKQAIDYGASYVHLGQEDLMAADVRAIKAAGIRIGISTHSEEELDRALACEPNYVALGPVYETTLKVMKWAPQGLGRVAAWKARIGALPLVAIGGITLERAAGVRAAGADSISVVGDVVNHPNPEARVAAWLAWTRSAT